MQLLTRSCRDPSPCTKGLEGNRLPRSAELLDAALQLGEPRSVGSLAQLGPPPADAPRDPGRFSHPGSAEVGRPRLRSGVRARASGNVGPARVAPGETSQGLASQLRRASRRVRFQPAASRGTGASEFWHRANR